MLARTSDSSRIRIYTPVTVRTRHGSLADSKQAKGHAKRQALPPLPTEAVSVAPGLSRRMTDTFSMYLYNKL